MNNSDPINEDIVQIPRLLRNATHDVDVPSDRLQTQPKQ